MWDQPTSLQFLDYGGGMPQIKVDSAFSKKAAKLLRKHPDKRKRVESALRRLGDDPRYPSLSTKKYDEARNIWQSYVEQGTPAAWRIWWIWHPTEADTIIVLSFGPHP